MEQVGVKDNYRLVQNLKSAGCFIVCILLTLVCLVPLYLMIVNACRGHNAILQSPVSLIPITMGIHISTFSVAPPNKLYILCIRA